MSVSVKKKKKCALSEFPTTFELNSWLQFGLFKTLFAQKIVTS